MPFPLAVFLVCHLVGLLVQLIQLVAILACKVRIEEFQIFYGKPLASFDLGRTRIQFGWIPTGSYSKYDIHQFALLSTAVRVVLIVLPSVILFGIGLWLLGPEKGWHHFLTGFRELVEGLLRPQAVGYALVGKLHLLYQQSPAAMVGVICMKWVAWSLLPIGYVTGPVLLQIFSPVLRPREGVERWITIGMMLGALGSFFWMGIFLVYAMKHWTA